MSVDNIKQLINETESLLQEYENELARAINNPPKPHRKVKLFTVDWFSGQDHWEDRLDYDYWHRGVNKTLPYIINRYRLKLNYLQTKLKGKIPSND